MRHASRSGYAVLTLSSSPNSSTPGAHIGVSGSRQCPTCCRQRARARRRRVEAEDAHKSLLHVVAHRTTVRRSAWTRAQNRVAYLGDRKEDRADVRVVLDLNGVGVVRAEQARVPRRDLVRVVRVDIPVDREEPVRGHARGVDPGRERSGW